MSLPEPTYTTMSRTAESLREFLDARKAQLGRRIGEAIDAEREALNARNILHSGIASEDTVARAATTLDEGVRAIADDLASFDVRLRQWDAVARAAAELVASVEAEAWDRLEGFFGDISSLKPQFDEAVANARAHLQVGCNRGRHAARERRRTITWDLVRLIFGALLGYVVGKLT